MTSEAPRPPLPPFDAQTAAQKVRLAENAWSKELDYRLIKELWAFHENRIAVRFAYEWHDSGNWFRSYCNENWEFDPLGYMRRPACPPELSAPQPRRPACPRRA